VNSGKFRIEVDPKAARDLKKLRRSNLALTKRIIKLIDSIPANPFLGKPLKGYKQGCYSLRSGDYRIIYEVYVSRKIIHIIRVGHRKDIYR
jgi:mRNA interferase RelE/StbE